MKPNIYVTGISALVLKSSIPHAPSTLWGLASLDAQHDYAHQLDLQGAKILAFKKYIDYAMTDRLKYQQFTKIWKFKNKKATSTEYEKI